MADKRKSGGSTSISAEATAASNRRDRRDRKATLEALRRQQRAKERRKTILSVTLASLVGLALIAVAAVPAILARINDPANRAPADFGVAAAAASCDPEIVEPGQGVQDHVGEGERVDYASAPPASGRHDGNFIFGPREFYEAADRPPVEKLVHSLEHGYTVVWYDDTITGEALEDLRGLATRMRTEAATRTKFIVAPWTGVAENRPALPEGKHVAFTRWGAQESWRQYCGAVSGEAVAAFVNAHPATDAPEPDGA